MRPVFPALLACAAIMSACGGGDERSFEVAAGDTLAVDLEGDAVDPALPDGAVAEGGRLTWSPAIEQIGEHALAFDVAREDGMHAVTLTIVVTEAEAAGPLTYGGCECGSLPRPPRPRADAATAFTGIAAWAWRRRRALRDA